MSSDPTTMRKVRNRRDTVVAALCGFVVALMVGAAYAAVPFYNWFCRVTGFNGTTQVATASPTFDSTARSPSFDANEWRAAGNSSPSRPRSMSISARSSPLTTRGQPVGARDRQAAYNVTRSRSLLFQQDQLLLLHRAASWPGGKGDGVVSTLILQS